MLHKIDIIDLASKFKFFSHNSPDDFVDKLNFKFTSFILLTSGVLIIYKQYFTNPISCYMANSPSKREIVRYLEHYCWVEGTVPISFQGEMPTNNEQFKLLEKEKILYYQWIPFIILIQALLCYIPQFIWQFLYTKTSNIDLRHLINKASKASNLDSAARTEEVEQLSQTLETLLFETQECPNKKSIKINRKLFKKVTDIFVTIKRSGAHLMIYYLIVKALYLSNSIGQIFLMQSYLNLSQANYTLFGAKILYDIINGSDWENSLVFPRVAFCFAKIRHLGAVNYAVAQCVLPLNMLNEKLYIFFWFWMIFISIATATSLVVWIARLVIRNFRTSFVKKYLILNNNYDFGNTKINKRIAKFEDYFLRSNGLFILQTLANNSGEIITAEVVSQLWKTYIKKYENRCQRLSDVKEESDGMNEDS